MNGLGDVRLKGVAVQIFSAWECWGDLRGHLMIVSRTPERTHPCRSWLAFNGRFKNLLLVTICTTRIGLHANVIIVTCLAESRASRLADCAIDFKWLINPACDEI